MHVNASFALDVLQAGGPGEDDIRLGQTPAPEPGIAIPEGVTWFVAPADKQLSDKELQRLAADLSRRGILCLSLRGCANISGTGVYHMAFVALELRSLDLSGTRVGTKGLLPLASCPRLQTLRFHDLEVDREEFACLTALSSLEVLDLSGIRPPRITRWDRLRENAWEGPDYGDLVRLWRLRTLVLRGARLSPDDRAALEKVQASLPRLQIIRDPDVVK